MGSVFVDPTGRRRRLVTAAGIAIGIALLSAISLLVAGALGTSPVRLPGLPAGGPGSHREVVVPAELAPSAEPAPRATSRPAGAPAGVPAAPSSPDPAASPPSVTPGAGGQSQPGRRGNKPTTHPGNGRPSRSR